MLYSHLVFTCLAKVLILTYLTVPYLTLPLKMISPLEQKIVKVIYSTLKYLTATYIRSFVGCLFFRVQSSHSAKSISDFVIQQKKKIMYDTFSF